MNFRQGKYVFNIGIAKILVLLCLFLDVNVTFGTGLEQIPALIPQPQKIE